jgi:subtilase family serine protease
LKLTIPDKPDFEITSSEITINPLTPSVGDTIDVTVKISNFGTVFPDDSVTVQLFVSSSDTSYSLNELRKQSFGEIDSVTFIWIPDKGGLYNLTARINEIESIPEIDHSDNEATALFPVYDLVEPSIINQLMVCQQNLSISFEY